MISVAPMLRTETIVTITMGLEVYSVMKVARPITGLDTKLVKE